MGRMKYSLFWQVRITAVVLLLLGLVYLYVSLTMLKSDLHENTNLIPFTLVSALPGILCLWVGCTTFIRMNSQRIHWMCIVLSTSLWPLLVAKMIHNSGPLQNTSVFALCALVCLTVYVLTSWRLLRYARKRYGGKRKPWRRMILFLYTFILIFTCQSVAMDLLPREMSNHKSWRMIAFFASLGLGVIVYKISESGSRSRDDHNAIYYGQF